MPTTPIYLIDTSVLANLLKVPGRSDHADTLQTEFERRRRSGAKFVIPITAIIETGNLIANGSGDRAGAARRLEETIAAARLSSPPWTIRDVSWNDDFLDDLLAGDSTGSRMRHHLTDGTLGTGDLAILVERDQFRNGTAFTNVRIWSLDQRLEAHG